MGLERLVSTIIAGIAFFSSNAPSEKQYAHAYVQDAKKQDEIPALKKERISFEKLQKQIAGDNKGDKAGKYHAAKCQYVKQVFEEFKLDQYAQGWFYWQDAAQNKKAVEKIKEDLVTDGTGKEKLDEWVSAIGSALPSRKAFYQHRTMPAQKKKTGYVLFDQALFELTKEGEVFSILDALREEARIHVEGLAELDLNHAILRQYRSDVIWLQTSCAQLEKIAKRSVGEGFAAPVHDAVATAYGRCETGRSAQESLVESTGVKEHAEARDLLGKYLKQVDEKLGKLGYKVELGQLMKLPEPKK